VCKPSNKKLDEEVSKIFFNVNTNSSYDSMVKYFRSQGSLTYLKEHGYTTYPPLSALGDRENKTSSELFAIKYYDGLKGMQKGGLFVSRMNPHNSTFVNLQMNFSFVNKAQAENTFNNFIARLKQFHMVQEDIQPFIQRRAIQEQRDSSTYISISLFLDDSLKLYGVDLHAVTEVQK